mmetsp:Transcript_2185/g.3297  ORF Transcript_2185/g.3297 Transcript_2185/m.3297 type:complete len:91 (+) Transcript_2185:100-372(+)
MMRLEESIILLLKTFNFDFITILSIIPLFCQAFFFLFEALDFHLYRQLPPYFTLSSNYIALLFNLALASIRRIVGSTAKLFIVPPTAVLK